MGLAVVKNKKVSRIVNVRAREGGEEEGLVFGGGKGGRAGFRGG